ncbi:type II secretion system protein G [Elusimicrobium simillimum]|uniref:type IV pilin protein n=1 Tax=Elusimicrobium simillimum TaxID=3143438 RepID=UPI003C6FF303
MKKGFTLIELLVVVLIIGILAAIALPQYTKAVEKSRAMQAVVAVKAAGEALQRYQLQHDSLPAAGDLSFLDELDIELPPLKNFRYSWWNSNYNPQDANFMAFNKINGSDEDADYEIAFYVSTQNYGTHLTCGAYTEKGGRICKALGTKFHSTKGGYDTYTF